MLKKSLIVLYGIFILLACVASRAGEPGWIDLFDGKSLAGWKASENPGSFKVRDGMIVADGPRAHLFYMGTGGATADFKNFELEAEARTSPGANSGIFFHTEFAEKASPPKGHEVQINNTNRPQEKGYIELKKTGSLYGVRNIYKPLVRDGEWFKMRIAVEGKHVRVWVNQDLTVDYVEPTSFTLTKRPGRRIDHGTFALQGHDEKSPVAFRNIRVKPLPAEVPDWLIPGTPDEIDKQILDLQMSNFPLIDFHIHLKGGLTIEEALARSRRLGINYGIAVNCGVGFPITSDAGIETFLKSVAGAPCFIGMQAEGREWVRLFTPQTVAKFDYVFTDGMTMMDAQGRRARLWVKKEYEVGEAQAFMERLVNNIVTIINDEPIDIYVNPLYIPAELQPRYDELWTPERKTRVIEALAKNGVALEISNKYLAKADFIKQAKAAGIKFTIGTNNGDGNFGRDEYALQMIKECGLTWQDMWMPKPDGQKPVQVKGFKKN